MRISDWSSDVCSSDLGRGLGRQRGTPRSSERRGHYPRAKRNGSDSILGRVGLFRAGKRARAHLACIGLDRGGNAAGQIVEALDEARSAFEQPQHVLRAEHLAVALRSEERRVGEEWVSTCESRWA